MREETINCRSADAFSDAVFEVIVTIMVLELRHRINLHWRHSRLCGPRPLVTRWAPCSSLSLGSTTITEAVCGPTDTGIDMDQLRPSLYGLAPAIWDSMCCAHPARVGSCRIVRRAVCLRRRCLQCLRAPRVVPCEQYPAQGESKSMTRSAAETKPLSQLWHTPSPARPTDLNVARFGQIQNALVGRRLPESGTVGAGDASPLLRR